ncbi:MAG: DUF3078 domain-containing protein, partial [Bacteroidales bacterium]|nr:DUF3078 domain-containing protein [Bacteroidales bacterium]
VDSAVAISDTIQTSPAFRHDTVPPQVIVLSQDEAVRLLQKKFRFRPGRQAVDPLYGAIGRLLVASSTPPFDSTKLYLTEYPFDSLRIAGDTLPSVRRMTNALTVDTIRRIDSLQIPVIADSLAFSGYKFRNDSIRAAVNVLLDYLEARDSSIIRFTGPGVGEYPLWLNSGSDRMIRFWLKNDLADSVTVWIGNPSRNTIGLYLEHGVFIRRPTRQGNVSEAKIDVEPRDNTTLVDINRILTKSQYWRYRTEASFSLNQGMVSNWVKGGENNISTALDLTWFADYNNKSKLLSSANFARMKYGLIKSGSEDIRKNLDLLETNSKLNHKAFGKFDFSAIMLFKTQISKGYNYPDETPVSKFFNPGVVTLGFGLDYKPNKKTSINLSPLSYKGTFVPDTAGIDQTKYGVAADRRSKHEPGASFMIMNEMRPMKNMVVTNRLQLFTNYVNNPLNIDVDWEMIIQTHLNWFTDVRLNTHLIFDDDTKTLLFDKDKNPVMGDDGNQKKTARVQFKELLGLSFIFRF